MKQKFSKTGPELLVSGYVEIVMKLLDVKIVKMPLS